MANNKRISELTKVSASNATDEFVLSRGSTNVSIESQYLTALSSSYALTASYAISASVEIKLEITSSFAQTASYAYSTTILSGSSSDARNELVTKISGSSIAPISSLSSSLTTTDQVISGSVKALSGSASDARIALSSSLVATEQQLSSSLVFTNKSQSTLIVGNLNQAFVTLPAQITAKADTTYVDNQDTALSSSASTARDTLSGSLTITDKAISSSLAALSGSASDARSTLKPDPFPYTGTAVISSSISSTALIVTGSENSLSGSALFLGNVYVDGDLTTKGLIITGGLTTTRDVTVGDDLTVKDTTTLNRITKIGFEGIPSGLNDYNLIVSKSAARNGAAQFVGDVLINGGLTSSNLAYPTTDGTANQSLLTDGFGTLSFGDASVDITSTTGYATFSSSLQSTDQAISASVATLSGSASDARNNITNVLSSSYALTASYALNGGSGSNPSIGSVGYNTLDNSFKTRASNVLLSSGTTSAIIDFDSSAIFEITTPTDTTATTLNFDNAEIGMSKMVLIVNQGTAGSGTITLGQTTGTGTFIRASSDDIVRTASITNYLQITCIGESGDDRTFVYTVGTAQ